MYSPIDERLNEMTSKVIGHAISIHSEYGPGLLESAYETILCHELVDAGFKIERQKALPLVHKGIHLEAGYRIDILVQGQLILEIKSVEHLADVHKAQLLTYLKLSGCRLGLLINFNTFKLKEGITRLVNG